jgi:iron(III) transport system substrate-binding protein
VKPSFLVSVPVFLFALLVVLGASAMSSHALAAAANAALDKAQKDAQVKGYLFLKSHDEIVSKAKQEGKLRVIVSTDAKILKHLTAGFRKKYPFIDIRTEEVRGNEVFLRMIQEMKAGLTKGQDVNDLAYDYYNEYPPYQKKFDILGMAEQRVLQIPVQMVDPINRNVVAMGSGIQVVAYNKRLIAADKVPDTWEGFLRPEFKDRKFVLDLRPKDVSALVPAWGLEKTLDFARKIAAQKPVWARGNVRVLTAMLAGEHALHFGPNFDSILRAREKDPSEVLAYKLIEPVPVRLNEAQSVLSTAENPYAALLWLEFVASPEGQKILDEDGPYEASLFISGTVQEKAVRGKKLSVVGWDHYNKIPEYERRIIEAYGFPKAE